MKMLTLPLGSEMEESDAGHKKRWGETSLRWSWRARKGSSREVPFHINYRKTATYIPQQKSCQQERINYRTQQEKMYTVSPPGNQPSRQLSQWEETVITLNSCFSPMGLTFKTTPQDIPPLHKIGFLSFACWTFLWFCCSFYVPNGSSRFPNKPIFCWQNDCCFIFKVNNWSIRLPSFQITQNIQGPGIRIKYPIRRYT